MSDATAADRKEYSRLRSVMVEPGNVYLASVGERKWLTDQFVILDVTGLSTVRDLEDGWYRIVGSGLNAGFRARTPGPGLNILAWLKDIAGRDYYPVTSTEISFTDNDAKAFLLIVDTASAARYEKHRLMPVAMNEDVWKSFRLAWPDAVLSHPGYTGPFRISIPGTEELAYVEPIQIPERLHTVAIAIVEVYESEPKG